MIKRNFLSTAFLASLLIGICASSFAQGVPPERLTELTRFRANLTEGTEVSAGLGGCGIEWGVVTELKKKAGLVRVQIDSKEMWIQQGLIWPLKWQNYVPSCSTSSCYCR